MSAEPRWPYRDCGSSTSIELDLGLDHHQYASIRDRFKFDHCPNKLNRLRVQVELLLLEKPGHAACRASGHYHLYRGSLPPRLYARLQKHSPDNPNLNCITVAMKVVQVSQSGEFSSPYVVPTSILNYRCIKSCPKSFGSQRGLTKHQDTCPIYHHVISIDLLEAVQREESAKKRRRLDVVTRTDPESEVNLVRLHA